MRAPEQNNQLIEQLIKHLSTPPLRGGGVAGLPNSWFDLNLTPNSDIGAESGVDSVAERADGSAPNLSQPQPSRGLYENFTLEQLRETALVCTKCRLCDTRDKVVFGVGKIDSPLIAFVGEGPGADEDRIGEPFVGRAGELLAAAITKGLGLKRSDVYIANVVKCRPPQNRAPLPDEVEACSKYLFRQLELIQPKVIITLGQPAQLALSGVNMGITKLRGQWQSWRGVKLMPTFHPAYLLRNPAAKKEFWEDLKAVMDELGLKRSGPSDAAG